MARVESTVETLRDTIAGRQKGITYQGNNPVALLSGADGSRNSHHAEPGKAVFHPRMDPGKIVISIVKRHMRSRMPVLVWLAILPLFLQPGLANGVSNGVDNCDKFIQQFVASIFFHTNQQKPVGAVQRAIENINIVTLGNIDNGMREYVKDIEREMQDTLPLYPPKTPNTIIFFMENVTQKILSNDEFQRWLGNDLASRPDSEITICRQRSFEVGAKGHITGSLMLATNDKSREKQVRECLLTGILRSVGMLGNVQLHYRNDVEDPLAGNAADGAIIGQRSKAIMELLYSDLVEIGQTPEEVSKAIADKPVEFCRLANGAESR